MPLMRKEPRKLPSGDIWTYSISLSDAAKLILETRADDENISPDQFIQKLLHKKLGIHDALRSDKLLQHLEDLARLEGFTPREIELYLRLAQDISFSTKLVKYSFRQVCLDDGLLSADASGLIHHLVDCGLVGTNETTTGRFNRFCIPAKIIGRFAHG